MAEGYEPQPIPQPIYKLNNSNIQLTNYTSSNPYTLERDAVILFQLGYNVSGNLFVKTNYDSNPTFIQIMSAIGSRSGAWERYSIFLPKGSQVYGEISGGTGYIVCYYYYVS